MMMKEKKNLPLLTITTFFLLSVVQSFAQTVNETSTLTWAFDQGTAGQTATYSGSTEGYFKQDYVSVGSNLSYNNVRTSNSQTFTTFKPTTQTGSGPTNAVAFNIRTVTGLTFVPTSISFDAQRWGTDSGLLDIYWVSSDGSVEILEEGLKPARDNSGGVTQASYDLSSLAIPASDGECRLEIILYDLGNTKEAGFADVTVEGTVSGTIVQVTTYTLDTSISPAGGGTIDAFPVGSVFDEGTEISLTAEKNFGYEFSHWADGSGSQVSTANPYEFTLSANTEVQAIFNTISTYELSLGVSGGANDYMVSASPDPTDVDGKNMYETGTNVTVSAMSNPILNFTNWNSGETSTDLNVTMDAGKEVIANYSAIDFIVGWDFYKSGNAGRIADFYSTIDNESSALILRKADGTTSSWLDKSTEAANGYEAADGAAVNWQQLTDQYYYQISFNATDFTNISVSADMIYNFNAYSVQRVEYSLDGTTFNELGTYTMNTPKILFSETFDLPANANNQPLVYIRWIPDYTSDLVGSTSDKDGTGISSIYVTGDEAIVDDGTAPVLSSSVPVDASTGASSTGKIVLTFDEKIQITNGTSASLGGSTLTPIVSGQTITFDYTGLDYNTQYTFDLVGNVVSDLSGNMLTDAISISFTTLDKPTVSKKEYDFIVGVDGDVKDAFDAAEVASSSGNRFYIFFPNGQYDLGTLTGDETQQTFFGVPNVSFIGESMDGVVLFNSPDASDEGIGTTPTINFQSTADNIYMQDLTILNKMDYRTGSFSGRAVALRDQGDKSIFKNVRLQSNQDTYYTGAGRSYWEQGEIHGTVDFIFGDGDIFFDETLIYLEERSGNMVTAAATSSDWGYVFNNCTIDGFGVNNGSYRLGRSWNNAPKVVYLNTTMNVLPTAEGWGDPMNVVPDTFAEYNSLTSGGGAVDLGSRRTLYEKDAVSVTLDPVLTQQEAANYTLANVLGGVDDWQPKLATEPAPIPVITLSDLTISWTGSDYVIGWMVFKNGAFADYVTANSYVIPEDQPGTYTVKAANSMGGLSSPSNSVSYFSVSENAPAFPGAEGHGRYTTGGRGGKVIHVTNLNDSGAGSLRAAIQQSGARIVVFDVSGIIELNSTLSIQNDNITIAGQTAPGDGITLKNYSLYFGADNVIVRFIRSRMGDEAAYEGDAMWGRNQKDVIIDHCTLSWSTDETGSFYDNENFTMQWCVLAESLRESVHGKGTHGYGGIWGGRKASFHHNFLAHHDSRNPRLNGSRYSGLFDEELVDFRNNVIYNWGGNSGYAGEGGSANFVNNYYKYGPATGSGVRDRIFAPNSDQNGNEQPIGTHAFIYADGNFMYGSESVTADNWAGIDPQDGMSDADLKVDTEFDMGEITTHSAELAFERVLTYAGTSLSRDIHDIRYAEEARTGTTTYIGSKTSSPKPGLIDTQTEDVGGWPAYNSTAAPTDTDQDGMPDDWEDANGLNKDDAADNKLYSLSTYFTNVEVYINSLVESITANELADGTPNYQYEEELSSKGITTITWSDPDAIIFGTVLSATQLNAATDGNTSTATYDPPVGTALDAGEHALKVTYAADDNFLSASKTVTITVNKAQSTVTWSAPESISSGTPLSETQLNATVDGTSGSAVYNPTIGTVLEVGTHTLNVTFPADANYETGTGSVEIEVLSPLGNDLASVVKIYPNPVVNDQIAVEVGLELNGSVIHLLSINGKVLQTKSVNSNRVSFDLSVMTQGVYLLKIEALNRSIRIIKN